MSQAFKHNDSMSEQGNFDWVELTGTAQIRISAGASNVRVNGSSTPVISGFLTPDRPGRKLKIWAADDTGASIDIDDVAGSISVASSTTTLAANQGAEFQCVPQSDGTTLWVQTWTNGTSS
jgi:hypothetical protein